MKQLNRTRLAAGLPIDSSLEVSDSAVPVTEAVDKPLNDFWVVVAPKTSSSDVTDCCHRVNAAGLVNIVGNLPKGKRTVQIFDGAAGAAAKRAAKKLMVTESTEEVDEYTAVLVEDEGVCSQCRNRQHEDVDFQAAWKLKSQANHLRKSHPEMAAGQAAAAAIHLEKFNKKKADLKCDDCKNGVVTGDQPATKAVAEAEQVDEFVIGGKTFDSWEENDKKATNTSSADGKTPDALQADSNAATDKNESPTQLGSLDTPSEQDQSGGGDHDRKVKIPNSIKTLLKAEIKKAEAEGERLNYSNRQSAEMYKDLAAMFTDLSNHLDGGTVYDIKQAQIFMTSLMGPMLHKIPAEVVNFLARGGAPASLKTYMNKVDMKAVNPNKLS